MGSRVFRVVLCRHGESEWNRVEDERFTGWIDVPLSDKGKAEATAAGEMLAEVRVEYCSTAWCKHSGASRC